MQRISYNYPMIKKILPSGIPFQIIDWSKIAKTLHPGNPGEATWQTVQHPGLRIRTVTYSAGYLADHWCKKGHIVHVLEGQITSELSTGETQLMTKGMSYVVSDDLSSHRSSTETGATLLIIDGDFLKLPS